MHYYLIRLGGKKMITDVEIRNFKSIINQDFKDLPSIVGIWGKNGTGKSSFLQALVWTAKNGGRYSGNGLTLDRAENTVFGRTFGKECFARVTHATKGKIQTTIDGGGVLQRSPKTFDEIRYFPPWRHISQRMFDVTSTIKSDFGYQAQAIHSFLHWFLHDLIGRIARGDKHAQETYEELNHWSEKIGFGKLLDIQEGFQTIGIYNDTILDLEIPVIDGGFGGNSFLPILLECYSFRNGIILIEEPEISLHPGAQGDIWEFMMEMVKERNHQIFFTSHSPYLAKKIARTLSEGKLENKVRVYMCSKSKEKGSEFKSVPTSELIKRFKDYWEDILPGLEGR